MSFRPAKSRVVGFLSIAYGVLISLFWAWVFWTEGRGALEGMALVIVPFVAAPVLLVVAGYALCSARVAGADARALKAATVVVLAIKAAVAGYWAIGLNFGRVNGDCGGCPPVDRRWRKLERK